MITFFIAFYNEERKGKGVHKFLKDLEKFIKNPINKKNTFVLYNDGSSDNTGTIVENFKKRINKNNVQVYKNITNRGVGFSYRQILKKCKTKYLFFIPGDNDLLWKDLLELKKYYGYDFAMLFPINFEKYSPARYLVSMLFRIIYGISFGIIINYIQAPCLYKVKTLRKHHFVSTRFSIWAEINTKLLKTKIKYIEIPVHYKNKSVIDRTINFKNLYEVIVMFLRTFIEIKFFKRKTYRFTAKKYYL